MKALRKYKILAKKTETGKIPKEAGIYVFWDDKKTPIYIGKANNLRARINSYFLVNLEKRTLQMVGAAEEISYITVSSELEALLLEAKLIKKYKPKFNSSLKDDKHPLYVRITKEKYPRVITARKIDNDNADLAFYGPFPSSGNVHSVLKMTRKIFPFSQHKIGRRGCIYNQIMLCNPCPNIIEMEKNNTERKRLTKEYQNNIRLIKRLLDGNLKSVRKALEKEMKMFSKLEKYEAARNLRNQIRKLDYATQEITPPETFLKNPNLLEDIRSKELNMLKMIINQSSSMDNSLKQLNRIECFDVAHLAGTSATASMVTFVNGQPDKSYYRHFRIKQKKGGSDFDSMIEVASRRHKYLKKWGKPDLIIVDGGKAQVSAFLKVFSETNIYIIGTAKRSETLIIPIGRNKLYKKVQFYEKVKLKNSDALNLVKRLRNEAHRFARRYHHHLVKKQLLNSNT